MDGGENVPEEGGLTFDDTSEFVRAISYNPVAVKIEPKETRASSVKQEIKDEPSQVSDVAMEELEAGELPVKEEEDDEAMLNAL